MQRIKAFLPAILLVVVIVSALILYNTFMAGVSAPGSGFQAPDQLLPSEQPGSDGTSAAPSETATAVGPSSTTSSSLAIGSSLAENEAPVTGASTGDDSATMAGSSLIEGLAPGGTNDQAQPGPDSGGQGDQSQPGSDSSGQEEQTASESGAKAQGDQTSSGSGEGGQESTRIKAPDFTVLDANGNTVKLSDMVGKPVVLNFWASWCPPCRQEMPDFDKVYKELGDKIHFFMVDAVDGSRETMEKGAGFIAENGFSFPVYYDVEREAVTQFGIRAYPTSFFIDKDGYAVATAEGAIEEASLRLGIDMITD